MSFLYKIIFAIVVFFIVGGSTLMAVANISINQETIVKTVSSDLYISN